MYKKIKIENFRGIKSLEIKDPKQFNLIVGKNNSCKTTVLESIFLLTGPTNPTLPMTINSFRGLNVIDEYYWSLFFNRLETKSIIKLYGEISRPDEQRDLTIKPLRESSISKPGNKKGLLAGEISGTDIVDRINGLTLEFLLKEPGRKESNKFVSNVRFDGKDIKPEIPGDYKNRLDGVFIYGTGGSQNNAQRFNNIQIKKQEKKVVQILQKIEPTIQDISVGSNDILYCDMGFDRLVPINMVGEGINRLLAIILAIYDKSNGIVMIDEVENGFHYSALEILWKAIFEAAREFNVQIFATTHSFENIRAYSSAYDKLAEKNDDLRLFRIEKKKDELDIISINHEILKTSIENDLEVR
ncbi:MAG: AAA family ATPase [Candidatus Aminicenantes bacterium]|nr:AAA family ATPase [Candidatus Aminicenantes bacterium]